MSQQSVEAILQKAKTGSDCDLAKLLQYGRKRGFQSFLRRKEVWPFLLGVNNKTPTGNVFEWEEELDKNSADYDQLQKDAERSLSTMKTFQNITKFHLQKRQRDVLKILDSFFAKNKNLKYIQGFHDVASIFLVIFGNSIGYYMMQQAGKTYFKDYLTQDIGKMGTIVSKLVLQLLIKKDRQFERIFECFRQMEMLPFIIPWVLTWFAHVFSSVKTIGRIWDYLLCTGPHGIVYITAGVILATKNELLEACSQLDHPSIQMFYQQKAKTGKINTLQIIDISIELEESFKFEQLDIYQFIPKESFMLSCNFELYNDLHRKVREYNKLEGEKKAKLRQYVLIASAVVFLGGLIIKYSPK